MKNLILIVCTLLSLFVHTQNKANTETSHYTINMFIKEYPSEDTHKTFPLIAHDFLPKQLIRSTFYQPVNCGIYGLYNGYIARSDDYGLISFPRDTSKESFTLIITNQLKPTFLIGNTVKDWRLTDPQQTALFRIRREKDPETKLYYWKVLKMNLPQSHKVPLFSIIIIAKPKNIYVPLGVTPTTKLSNLVLPPIYAKRGLDRINNALFVLNVKQFFSPIKKETKTSNLSREQILTF